MRPLGLDDLRAIVTDPAELAKGARLLDDGALAQLARHGDRLYADAAGAMAAPYKVSVEIGSRVTGRCTCMAARTRPFCKHAAALLVAWARAPEAFVESDGPPPGERERARRAVKKGKVDVAALRADGVARALALLRELALTGVASVAAGRAAAIRGLAEALRAGTLRRLAGRVHRLADLVERAEAGAPLPVDDYAEVVADVLLTARKIEKHLGGEPLDDRHVEELIGKTWRKADRAPVEGLELVEVAAGAWETPDGFVVREQRFVDVATGAHYADRQILPAFLARRTAPRPSLAGLVAAGAAGSLYPGYPPRRLDLEHAGTTRDLDAGALARLVATALPGAAAALAALQDLRRDVFAPDALPVTVRLAAIIAGGPRLRAADVEGWALHLPDDAGLEAQLAGALRGAHLRVAIGDLVIDRALPVLVPRAVVVEADGAPGALRLERLAAAPARAADAPGADWAASARAAGASAAAVSLAEVRGELAELLARGAASQTSRAVEPLAARLRELGLERPAQVVAQIPARAEPERLDEVVRAHQVLGLALIRVVGAVAIAETAHTPVPGIPSARVPRPDRWLPLDEVVRSRAAEPVTGWAAAAHAARALAEVPPARLVAEVHPWWAHAGLSEAVAAAVAAQPGAVAAARAVLAPAARAGRVAQQTAIRVLVAADLAGAPRHVAELLGPGGDVALGGFALEQIDAARERRGDPEASAHRRTRRRVAAELARALAHAGGAEDRRRAAFALGDTAEPTTAGALRRAWLTDPSADVREAAAIALGRRADPDAIDAFVAALARRGAGGDPPDERAARAAALALGQAGDVRGAIALVDALAAGWRSPLLADCLRHAGAGVLPPLRAAVAAQPALAKRKAVKELLAELSKGG